MAKIHVPLPKYHINPRWTAAAGVTVAIVAILVFMPHKADEAEGANVHTPVTVDCGVMTTTLQTCRAQAGDVVTVALGVLPSAISGLTPCISPNSDSAVYNNPKFEDSMGGWHDWNAANSDMSAAILRLPIAKNVGEEGVDVRFHLGKVVERDGTKICVVVPS